jgi:hypothetical protein
VVEVPVWFCVVPCVPPVTDPALPATPDVPWVDVPWVDVP